MVKVGDIYESAAHDHCEVIRVYPDGSIDILWNKTTSCQPAWFSHTELQENIESKWWVLINRELQSMGAALRETFEKVG